MTRQADCCGAVNFTDWSAVEFGSEGAVPDSCCLETTTGCGAGVLQLDPERAAEVVHTRGCVPAVLKVVEDNWVYLAAAASVLVAVEVSESLPLGSGTWCESGKELLVSPCLWRWASCVRGIGDESIGAKWGQRPGRGGYQGLTRCIFLSGWCVCCFGGL